MHIVKACRTFNVLTDIGGTNKYTIKYVGKIDAQNYVIVHSDNNKNGRLVTKASFVHNSKLSSSKYNEEKAFNQRREKSHATGRAISLTEMLHNMLMYSEVATDLNFIDISTTPLEFRHSSKIYQKNKTNNIQDGSEVGNVCNNVRKSNTLTEWRKFTNSQLIILEEHNLSLPSSMDKISEFSVRPPELCSCFDQVGNYYRWFYIEKTTIEKEKLIKLLNANLSQSTWIDSHFRVIRIQNKAINEAIKWLDDVISKDDDFYHSTGKFEIYHMMKEIYNVIVHPNNVEDEEFITHATRYLIYNDDEEEHLPIPVYSYIRPTMGTQFILHILLSLGRYTTEIDLILQPSLRDSFRYAKLIGSEDNIESLQKYSDEVFVLFIESQMIYFPNSRNIIDEWINVSADLFNEVIINNSIPINNMPPVQQTTLIKSIDDKCVNYINKLKRGVLMSALKELNDAITQYNIPSIDDLLNATKEKPLQ